MKVSVVLPVYNVERHLPGCLDSIARQTFRDFEVIAVDDGSTDDSGRLLDEYEASFPLRRVHQGNQGVSATRNAALDLATGDYVLMVDSDDCIHPRLLELTVGAAEALEADWVAFDYVRARLPEVHETLAVWANDRAEPLPREIPTPGFDWFVGTCRKPTPWQMLYRRSTLAGHRFRTGIVYEDVPFLLTYLARPHRGLYLRKQLYCYVANEVSITRGSALHRRIAGYETGMRMLKEALDPRRYRLFVRNECAVCVRDLHRRLRTMPPDADRSAAARAFDAFVRRILREELAQWSDFSLIWRLRLLPHVWADWRCA